jgi:hypothetical protein
MFTIDVTRVQELMQAKPPSYSTTASHLVRPLEYEIPSATVYGVDLSAPASMIDAQKHISELRKRVISSGITLRSAKEIDQEISEMRRHIS